MNEEIATGALPANEVVPRFREWLDENGYPEGWVVLELGDPFSDSANRVGYPRVALDAANDGRIAHGVWRTRGFTAQDAANDCATLSPQLFVAEGEIPAYRGDGSPNPQAQDWVALADALEPYPVECAVATSFTPFRGPDQRPSQELADPLIEAGWYCLPYVYPSEHLGVTVEQQVTYAAHYGPEWAHAEPVLGVYGGYTIDSPEFAAKASCPGFSLWDAGEVL